MINTESLIAKKLLQIKAIKLNPQNPFTWASGLKSPIYCDNRITLSFPETRNIIKHAFGTKIQELGQPDMICGVATAGIAHGALLADLLNLPFSYVRSSPKEHGRQNQIEGEIPPNSKIVIVEDLISTGGSSIEVVEILRNEGHDVLGVLAIFDYCLEKAKENFRKSNCKFISLSNYSHLIVEAMSSNYITIDDANILKTWSSDPQKWSLTHSSIPNN